MNVGGGTSIFLNKIFVQDFISVLNALMALSDYKPTVSD